MVMRTVTWGLLLTAAVLMGWPDRAVAVRPWSLVPFKRVEADANKSYELTERNGPWMILAASFAGEGAERDAHQLVLELRKRYKLPAFIHKRNFDFTKSVEGRGLDRYGRPKRMRYAHSNRFDEIAVMVGNYPSVEDGAAQRTLKKIKYAQPKCLQLSVGQRSNQRMAVLRAMQKRIQGNKEKKKKGPMGSALLTRNPLPIQKSVATVGLDRFVLKINKNVPHSLLDCPGKYTVKVATFRGNVVIDQQTIQDINKGTRKLNNRLEKAAIQAHKLTKALRRQGVDAYEFHDRHESIVTVGSFQSVGTPRADGKIEINPGIHQIIKSYGAGSTSGGRGQGGFQPKTLQNIAFDIAPIPVVVPRRSIAADYR